MKQIISNKRGPFSFRQGASFRVNPFPADRLFHLGTHFLSHLLGKLQMLLENGPGIKTGPLFIEDLFVGVIGDLGEDLLFDNRRSGW